MDSYMAYRHACPDCSEDMTYPDPKDDETVRCEHCGDTYAVNYDADVIEGVWHDRTSYKLVEPPPHHTDVGCGICRTPTPNGEAKAWTGEPICEACENTFAACAYCRRHMEPHQERERDGLVVCPACGPTDRQNRIGVKRHPAAIASDALDAECAERIAREP